MKLTRNVADGIAALVGAYTIDITPAKAVTAEDIRGDLIGKNRHAYVAEALNWLRSQVGKVASLPWNDDVAEGLKTLFTNSWRDWPGAYETPAPADVRVDLFAGRTENVARALDWIGGQLVDEGVV